MQIGNYFVVFKYSVNCKKNFEFFIYIEIKVIVVFCVLTT